MTISRDQLLSLPVAEKLEIVELLWDNLGESDASIPLPEWVTREALRRREEMLSDPASGKTHEQVWKSIHGRNE